MQGQVQDKKKQLIANFAKTRNRLLRIAAFTPIELEGEVFLGSWSITELYTHFYGWDRTNIMAIREILQGKIPGFYAYKDRDWQSFNARLIREYRKERFQDILSSIRESHQILKRILEDLPADELYRDRGIRYRGYKVLISRLIEAETGDENIHYQQVKQFLRRRK